MLPLPSTVQFYPQTSALAGATAHAPHPNILKAKLPAPCWLGVASLESSSHDCGGIFALMRMRRDALIVTQLHVTSWLLERDRRAGLHDGSGMHGAVFSLSERC